MYAVVHCVEPQEGRLVKEVTTELSPRNVAERAVAKRFAHDLVRLERVQVVADAAIELQRDDVHDEELKTRLTHWEKQREYWMALEQQAMTMAAMSRGKLLELFDSLHRTLIVLATQVRKEFKVSDAKEFEEDARLMMLYRDQLDRAEHAAHVEGVEKELKNVSSRQASRITDLTSELTQQVARREAANADLHSIPPDDVVRRLDRYTRMIQNSMLRQISILRGLRQLEEMDSPGT